MLCAHTWDAKNNVSNTWSVKGTLKCGGSDTTQCDSSGLQNSDTNNKCKCGWPHATRTSVRVEHLCARTTVTETTYQWTVHPLYPGWHHAHFLKWVTCTRKLSSSILSNKFTRYVFDYITDCNFDIIDILVGHSQQEAYPQWLLPWSMPRGQFDKDEIQYKLPLHEHETSVLSART